MIQDLSFHKLASLFPLIEGNEFSELVVDVKEHGVRTPLVLCEGQILDGRNRYLAAKRAGLDSIPTVALPDEADPLSVVISLNLRRRHLDSSQRALVAARLATLGHGGDRSQKIGVPTISEAAQILNVSPRSVASAREVLRRADQGVVERVEKGELSVSVAEKLADLPQPEQREILEQGNRAAVAFAHGGRSGGARGRAEFAELWALVDDVRAALERSELTMAQMHADRLSSALARINAARREKAS